MNNGSQNKRLTYIDSLKGFAAILVALGHTANRFAEASQSAGLTKISTVIYMFHMPLFVFLSGLVFEKSYKSDGVLNKAKYKAALINLAILYLFYDVIFVLSKILIGGFSQSAGFIDLLLLAVRPFGELWYLYVMILFYLIFGFGFWNNQKIRVIASAVLFIISSLSPFLFFNTYSNEATLFSWQKALFLAIFFFAGMMYENGINEKFKKISECTSLAVAIALIFLYVFFDMSYYSLPILSTIVALGITFEFFDLFKRVKSIGKNRLLLFAGRHALDIYIIHLYVIEILWRIYSKIGINSPLLGTLFIALLSVIISLAISLLLEKIGLYNLFFRPYKYIESMKKK